MKHTPFIAAAVALALVAAACGSDADSTPAAEPAATTAVTDEPAAESADDAAAAEVAAAGIRAAAFTEAPTAIPQLVPLTGPVEQGATVVIIGCELPQCGVISDGAIAAAEAIGWKTEYLQYDALGDAYATLHQAMVDALQYDQLVVFPIGAAQQAWDDLQPQYAEAGITITTIATGDTAPSDVVTQGASDGADYVKSGAILADWFIEDSGAKGKALVQDVPAYVVLQQWAEGFRNNVAANCTECEIVSFDAAPAQIGELCPTIVSKLQKDPDIEYLITSDGAFLPCLPSALAAAGIEGIKIAGGAADVNNFLELTTGGNAAWSSEAPDQFGWIAVDIAARHLLGMDIEPSGGGRLNMLVTADNVGNPDDWALGLPYPTDYEAQFKLLWGV
jgi:ribose transport system substrate-binding protein